MKLYEWWRSSASWRVRWALALKGLPYESVMVDLPAGDHHRVLAPINPMHAVPTLELDDGRVLTESVAIIEWLEETHPHPALLPADPLARARVRTLVQTVNAGIHPLQNLGTVKRVSPEPDGQRAWARHFIEKGLAAYETLVAGTAGRFSAGDQLSMADLYLVPQVRNCQRWGADISALRRVNAIYAACLATPEAQATDPEIVRQRAGL